MHYLKQRFLENNIDFLKCSCGEDLAFRDTNQPFMSDEYIQEFGFTGTFHCLNCGSRKETIYGDNAKKINDLIFEYEYGDDD